MSTKFLVILMYYERPNMVRFALDSIAAQQYDNFEVAVIDDSSTHLIEPVLENYNLSNRVKIYHTHDTIENKLARGGSEFGKFVNQAIDESDCDVALMLCDDDALLPDTLESLDRFYQENEFITYSYGHVQIYNPYDSVNYQNISGSSVTVLNNNVLPINGNCQVDASQVSWRIKEYKQAGIRFPHPQTSTLDAHVYQQMYDTLGPCVFNGLFVQYKGIYDDQLGNRIDFYRLRDKESYSGS